MVLCLSDDTRLITWFCQLPHIRIFKHYIPSPLILLGLVEICLLFVSLLLGYSLGYELRFKGEISWTITGELFLSAVFFATVMMACTAAMGVYSSGLRDGHGAMIVRTVVAYCLLGCSALMLIYYLVPYLYQGRGALASSIIIALLLVLPVRWIFLQLVDADSLSSRILVLGVGKRARQFSDDLEKGHSGIARIAGFIESGESVEPQVPAERIISRAHTLRELARQHEVSEIVIALDDRRAGTHVLPLDELFQCKMHGLKVNESITVSERELGIIQLSEISPGWLVFEPGFYSGAFWQGLKRFFDILISLLILLVTLPFTLLTAVAIFLETGSPVIYRQMRVGLEGKEFEILKFRSMTVDAEKDGEAVWAQKNDSRVTRVGSFIRNTRLDELPQLINVLRGDMSIVGPRPERPEMVDKICNKIPYYNERHHARPGLMGWAQLNYPYGASIEDSARKLQYDLYYVKNRSLMLDFIIILQTVQVVLLGSGVR